MSGLAQTQSVHARLTNSESASSYSEEPEILSHEEYPPIPHEASEEVGAATDSPKRRHHSTSSLQVSDLKTVVQESPTTGGWRRSRRRLTKSTLSGRQDTRRQRRTELRLLSVFLTVTLGIYLTKYLSQCVWPPRHAGLSSDATPPGLQRTETRFRLSGPLSTATGKGRRLAAEERDGGSGDSPGDTASQEESKNPFCNSPGISGDAEGVRLASSGNSDQRDVGPFGDRPAALRRPASSSWALAVSGEDTQGSVLSSNTSASSEQIRGGRVTEAQLLREFATKVMGLAAEASSMLSALTHSSTEVRGALLALTEIYGTLLNGADNVEKGIESEGRHDRPDGDKHQSVAGGERGVAEKDIESLVHSGKGIDDTQAVDQQKPRSRQPILTRLDTWDGNAFPLGTIFEVGEDDVHADDDNIVDTNSLFRIGSAPGGPKEKPLSLAQAISVVGMPQVTKHGWDPFSSATSTSDAWENFVTQQRDAKATAGDDANDVTSGQPRRPSYSEVLQHPPARSHSAPPRSTAANGKGMAKRVAGLGQRLTSSGHRQSATSRDASDERRHYPSGPRVPGRRPTNRFESIDRSANYRRAGARPSLPSRPPPKPPLPQISKVGFGASGTPVQRGASQGGTPSGSEKRDGGEPSKDVKGQGEDAGQPGASGGPLGGAGGGGRRPGDDERDDDKRKKGKGSSSGGGEKKKEEQEKKAKKERDQREEAKKESKPVDDREARGKEVKQGDGGLSSDSGKGSTGEEAGKKKAKKDRGRRAIEETVTDVTDAGVTSEATGGVPKEAEPQKDGEDRGVHGGGRGGEGPGSAGATETGDGLQHDSGGIGSGSEDRDKSRSETAAREKQVSKRQKSSGGRRKKKGASVAPQTGQTTTGEAPRSAVDSEGGRAGPLAASDKNKAGTDEGGRDAKGDEDGEAATAGPRAGAQHTGEHGGETEVVGETVKVAEADEEGSDAAAQREALRTGARPKTSSAAGRRKQKVKEQHAEQAESVSTRVSAAAEVQEVASRGRARHRTRAPDTRAGTGGSHKGVKASLGPSDGKGGQDGDVTSAGSVRKGPRSGGVDILSVSLNISFKTTAVLAEYRRELESLAMMAGAMELLDKAVNGKVSLEEIDAHDFTVLSQAVILEAEITFKLDSLHEVANGLINLVTGKKQAATKEEAATPAEAVSTSVTETSRGTEENGGVFEEVLGNIQDALSVARQRGVALLSTELRLRAHAIEKYVLPELPAIDLPPLPHQSGYDPKSKDVLHTSGGQSLPVAIPSTAVFILKDCLSQWKVTAESGALSSLEERWWTPPSDPEEAKRQKERTASAFQMAASLVSLRVLHEISRRWDLSDAIRRSDDPRVRRMLHETSGLLTSAIKAEVLASRLAVEDYANLIRETARANVRRPDEAWRPLSTNQHAPEIRAAMDASDKEAGAHAPVYERRPDVLDGTETHEKDGGDESTMQ